jgi:dephospho-CoA kinase
MIKVGMTGGIGSGKTTVCKMFELLGIPIYYADERAKKLMTSNKTLKKGIIDLLGKNAYYRNGRINRSYVAKKVFNDKDLLSGLNGLVHPAVGVDYLSWCKEHVNAHYTIKEAALLIESGSYKQLDQLIVVAAPEAIRIERVMLRDKSNAEEVKARIRNQIPEQEKIQLADIVIDNGGERSLIKQIITIDTHLNNI